MTTLTIPTGAKPSKALSKDRTRPTLCHAAVRHHAGSTWLTATDSFIAVALELSADAHLEEMLVPREVLEAAERGCEVTQIENGWAVDLGWANASARVYESGRFPDVFHLANGLLLDAQLDLAAEPVGLHLGYLNAAAAALGVKGKAATKLQLTGTLKAVRVTRALVLEERRRAAIVMPVRLDA